MQQKHVAPISKSSFKQEAVVSAARASGSRRADSCCSVARPSSLFPLNPALLCVCLVFGNVTEVFDIRISAVCSHTHSIPAAAHKSCSLLFPICFALSDKCMRNGPRVSFLPGVLGVPRSQAPLKIACKRHGPPISLYTSDISYVL